MMSEDVLRTPLGPCRVAVRDGRVCRLAFGGGRGTGRVPEARHWLILWFAGREPRVPLDLSWATPFERRVYRVVRRIAPGRTLTYGEVARQAGRPRAARAVGRALGRNRICLFIP
jgi:O6-methylguanine-DNA--protein-cysteine methyltransferase